MRLEYVVICDYASDFGGKYVLVGTFDRINAPQVPIQLGSMGMAMRFRLEKGDPAEKTYKIEVRFRAPNGQPLFNIQGDMAFRAPAGSTPEMREMESAGMVFNAAGPVFGTCSQRQSPVGTGSACHDVSSTLERTEPSSDSARCGRTTRPARREGER
jgi:hypothetical protein